MNNVKHLLGLNLVFALALAAIVVPAKKSESFSNSRDDSRREAQSASYRGPQHKEHPVYGRSDATTQGPMTTNAELRLPQDVVLSRISGEALVLSLAILQQSRMRFANSLKPGPMNEQR